MLVVMLWLYTTVQRGMVTIPSSTVSSTVKDKGQNPAVAPKQFIKDELPEKSLKTFKDVKVRFNSIFRFQAAISRASRAVQNPRRN